MRVLLFGASGMVGQGVLRECLASDQVTTVVCVGRQAVPQVDTKLRQVVRADVADLSGLGELGAWDACFFPLGVSSAGMREAEYRRVTFDLTMAVARQLAAANPGMVFVYVSGAGTDAKGRAMWSRVKGETEDALLALFPKAYMFRPGLIRPLDGIRPRSKVYRRLYVALAPVVVLWSKVAPGSMNTTRSVGQAMLGVALHGFPKRVLDARDINDAAGLARTPRGA